MAVELAAPVAAAAEGNFSLHFSFPLSFSFFRPNFFSDPITFSIFSKLSFYLRCVRSHAIRFIFSIGCYDRRGLRFYCLDSR